MLAQWPEGSRKQFLLSGVVTHSAIPVLKSLGLEDWRQLKVSLVLWYRPLIPVLERSKGIQVSFDLMLASLVYIVSPEQPESHTVTPWSQTIKQNKLCTRQSCHRKHSSQGLVLYPLSPTAWGHPSSNWGASRTEGGLQRDKGCVRVNSGVVGCCCSAHSKGWRLLFTSTRFSALSLHLPSVWSQLLYGIN